MYWKYEITDKEFDELMLFIKEKKKDGVKVSMNSLDESADISINNLFKYLDLKDEIRFWLKNNRAKEYKTIEEKYKNSEWKIYERR